MLVEFEQQCIANGLVGPDGLPEFLKIRVHMTRGWNKADAEKLFLQDDAEGGDLIIQDAQGRGLQVRAGGPSAFRCGATHCKKVVGC